MMDKYLITIRNIAFLAGLFFLVPGCGDQAETPSEPKMVSKKIIAKKDTVPPQPQKIEVPVPKQTVKPKAEPVAPPERKDVQEDVPKTEDDETTKQLIASIAAMAQKKKSLDTTDVYNPEGKIDPFASLFKEEPAVKPDKKREKRIPRTPIEKVDVSQLKLVGVILAPSGNKAMVEESSGKGYIITEGTPIGIHWGKVVKILKDTIIVEEEVEDIYGKTTKRKRELKLQKPFGEI